MFSALRPAVPNLVAVTLVLAMCNRCYGDKFDELRSVVGGSLPPSLSTRSPTARDSAGSSSLRALRLLGVQGTPNTALADMAPSPPAIHCDFEVACPWEGKTDGFLVTTGKNISELMGKGRDVSGKASHVTGPTVDGSGNPNGSFLYVGGSAKSSKKYLQVYSQEYNRTQGSNCVLKLKFHAQNLLESKLGIFAESPPSSTVVEIAEIRNVANNSWIDVTGRIGHRRKPFRLILDVWPQLDNNLPFHAAFDDIQLVNCFPEPTHSTDCHRRFECEPNMCVSKDRVCDINQDCKNGADEKQRCDELINWNAYCNFENDTCAWENSQDDDLEWIRRTGQMTGRKAIIYFDHTFKNESGHYWYLNTHPKTTFGHGAKLMSPVFLPPPRSHSNVHSPYYNSCQARFYYRMFGPHTGELIVNSIEIYSNNSLGPIHQLWRDSGNKGEDWLRAVITLPYLTSRYRLQFVGRLGLRHTVNISIDDISLSPECFVGHAENKSVENHDDLRSGKWNSEDDIMTNMSTRYKFSTCNAVGRRGPTLQQCKEAYRHTSTKIDMTDQGLLAGVQKWTVPKTGVFSIIAKGAGGGKGIKNRRPSKGSLVTAAFNFTQGDVIYILVGQSGGEACVEGKCSGSLLQKPPLNTTGDKGGGGGGGTYVFKMDSSGTFRPLLVASGGGGLSYNITLGSPNPDGRGENSSVLPSNGKQSNKGAGGGGGWNDTTSWVASGKSLLEGAIGGQSCQGTQSATFGGFGGGGGACLSGGGGGGFTGGDAPKTDDLTENGLGGYSYTSGSFSNVISGHSTGPGSVIILPAFMGCNCEYLCVVLDVDTVNFVCLCPEGHSLNDDNRTCLISELITEELTIFPMEHLMIIVPVTTVIILCVATVMFFLYHRYRRQMAQTTAHSEHIGNPEMQLNRLRQATGGIGGMVTEYNPNYEFGGSNCTIQDLQEANRENITLVKALGQGAFGEVYQGYLSKHPIEVVDIPVAVKTLPEMSSNQAEMDFLMEALIMSKFSHPNIVKFIGVCFEKLPKFIVLELLPGGDLKTFLRESRPKPDKPSPLTMKDLLMLAIDVAKGCQYLEENHFIHRDIAARNCLLTTKDVTRVVKIADFGMARDIYRADYYRKGGKAMLPVKWMPPEAFLDGIFTSKTDVWSFGVLLWEVMSLGYMPYPGRGNQDVMQLVTSGGRLDPPSNCPQPVYHIMAQCWHSVPEERPNFATILERLGYCLQDPAVINAPLPVFHRPPSTERDATVMRPSDSDNVCLQVQRSDKEPQSPASTDYLIPIPSSSYSLCTERTELQSASSMDSVDHLLELDDKNPTGNGKPPSTMPLPNAVSTPLKPQSVASLSAQPASGHAPSSWETSFMQGPPQAGAAEAGGPGGMRPSASPTTATWSGGYQSIPTHEDLPAAGNLPSAIQFAAASAAPQSKTPLAMIPPPESSPARKSPPSAIARQRPSVKKPATATSTSPNSQIDRFGATAPSMAGQSAESDSGATAAFPKTSLPLDPSSLSRQHPTGAAQGLPPSYANVSVASSVLPTNTDLLRTTTTTPTSFNKASNPRNEPYTITAPRGAAPPSNKGKYDRDGEC